MFLLWQHLLAKQIISEEFSCVSASRTALFQVSAPVTRPALSVTVPIVAWLITGNAPMLMASVPLTDDPWQPLARGELVAKACSIPRDKITLYLAWHKQSNGQALNWFSQQLASLNWQQIFQPTNG